MIPLTRSINLARRPGFKNLFIKNDGLNPSGSFKDRASFVVVAHCMERRLQQICVASSGNAGGIVAPIEPIAKENDMKEPGWYSMRKAYRCRKYVGGDYIGVWESVTLDIVGDSGSETMHIKLADHPCGESELTKLLYDGLLRRMTDLYGEAAMTMPATKKEWFSVRQKASSRQGLDVVCFSFKLFPLPLMHVVNFQGRNCV